MFLFDFNCSSCALDIVKNFPVVVSNLKSGSVAFAKFKVNSFNPLKTDKKIWINWNSSLEDKNTVVRIIQSILVQEQNAEISPINEYMRHIFKAFTYFVNKTLDTSVNKFRFGEDIGEIEKEISLEIDNKLYKAIVLAIIPTEAMPVIIFMALFLLKLIA